MRYHLLSTVSLSLLLASPLSLQAQEKGKEGRERLRENRPGIESKLRDAKLGENRPGDGKPGEGRPGMPVHPLMAAIDTDHNGILSASEIENASKALLKLDKNGDGVLTNDELRPDFSAMAGGMPRPGEGEKPGMEMLVKMFESRDADRDGKLSGEEIPERMRDRLGKVDENGDGAIDRAEMRKAMSMLGDRVEKGRGEKGDKDGSGVRPKRPDADPS